MKAFKIYLSFTIPLVSMLLSFSIYLSLDKSINNYKQSIINDYSIVIVSKDEITQENLENLNFNIDISRLEIIKNDQIVENLKQNLSPRSMELLNQKLPLFYKLFLDDFPTTDQLKKIQEKITSLENISNVEIFSKNHDKIYSILFMSHSIISILFMIIILFSMIILSKHITIWFYENQEKISIMKLHGASIFYRATPLIKVALYSALLSSIIVIIITYYISLNASFSIPIIFNFNFIQIVILSLVISIGTVLAVFFKYKLND